MSSRKKKSSLPKPRHVWKINPKTRVEESHKHYKRARDKEKQKDWLDDIHWFGEA